VFKRFSVNIFHHTYRSEVVSIEKGKTQQLKRTPIQVLICDIDFLEPTAAFIFALGFNQCSVNDEIMPGDEHDDSEYFERGWLFKWKIKNMLTINRTEYVIHDVYAVVSGKDLYAQDICDRYEASRKKRRGRRG
jgi:hypothetical protein